MCYYNGQKVTKEEYIRLKHLEKLVANYDFLKSDLLIGFDYNTKAVLKPIEGKEDFDIVQMEWGFIPIYWKTREDTFKWRNGFKDEAGNFKQLLTLNAMSEEFLAPKKVFRNAALKRRCLILSTGFYEWRHIFPVSKKKGKPLKTSIKYPYFISLKEKEYFYMAGLWQPFTDANTGEYVESCAIVTTKANELMEKVHNTKKRMPTILNEDLAWDWMFGNLDEKRISEIGATQFPSDQMQAWSINKSFLSSLCPNDPVVYPELPSLDGGNEEVATTEQGSLF